MARKRMIDPSFWEDEKLGSCEPLARLLFMGLISQADDEGRLKGHPSLLRSVIFPYDEDITNQQIDVWLNMLGNLILRYEVGNQRYIWVINFKKHQTINKPQGSKLPIPPDNYGSSAVVVTEDYGSSHVQEKLKEEKLKEEEVKISEGSKPSHNFLPLINKLNLKCKGIWESEKVESYLITMDVDLIEEALKMSEHKKSVAYSLGILNDWEASGHKHLSDIKPKVGGENEKSQGSLRHGQSTPEDKPITGGKTGILPSKWADKVIQMPNVSG